MKRSTVVFWLINVGLSAGVVACWELVGSQPSLHRVLMAIVASIAWVINALYGRNYQKNN